MQSTRAATCFVAVLLSACGPSTDRGGGGAPSAPSGASLDGLTSIEVSPPNATLVIQGTTPATSSYTAIGTLWLLAIAAGATVWRRGVTAAIAICWILLQGTLPLGSPAGDAMFSLPSQLASITIAILAVWPRREPSG